MTPVVYQILQKNDNTTLYVGSTICLQKRVLRHAYCTRNVDCYKTLLYTEIVRLGGWDQVEVKVLQQYPGITRGELYQQEWIWQSVLKPAFNLNKAFTPLKGALYHKQYRSEKPREYFNNKLRSWRLANPEKHQAARSRELEKRRELRLAANTLAGLRVPVEGS